ncbi:TnpV protein [Beduinella massiliensis]|uniref:TnpV protein n=1 Tax=Beduinella massiliensis TaxID=1852363 RepID=UPI000C82F41F
MGTLARNMSQSRVHVSEQILRQIAITVKIMSEKQVCSSRRKGHKMTQNTLTYTQNGDYQIPNMVSERDGDEALGKYGRMRKKRLFDGAFLTSCESV